VAVIEGIGTGAFLGVLKGDRGRFWYSPFCLLGGEEYFDYYELRSVYFGGESGMHR
jgi:hypothetical protein